MGRFRRTSFIVRVVQDGRGQASGIVERVATGAEDRQITEGGED